MVWQNSSDTYEFITRSAEFWNDSFVYIAKKADHVRIIDNGEDSGFK